MGRNLIWWPSLPSTQAATCLQSGVSLDLGARMEVGKSWFFTIRGCGFPLGAPDWTGRIARPRFAGLCPKPRSESRFAYPRCFPSWRGHVA